ncbi:hypothetical protein PCC6912_39700 [Chlorogloeopsis fritschii PCC 6912]|uniref:Uncharacterized protein n=1 Tax=Chlorogloeopsis fritschii PCC 6912 TaxID=211165 RepID=A0A3S0ZIX4_CHLFR|nr:hypothetical protein [Chlorogloeopsis fritschii]RUR77011.1 hypothetical protein PCC6912_39700 [Chlorogloeopsis fritschii PCC 6912]
MTDFYLLVNFVVSLLGINTFLIILFLSVVAVDSSKLEELSYTAQVVDKWHKNQCTSVFDREDNYVGESCDNAYTLVLVYENHREELSVSGERFKSLLAGNTIDYSYTIGRLGFKRKVKITPHQEN